jgi:hypothetical protein
VRPTPKKGNPVTRRLPLLVGALALVSGLAATQVAEAGHAHFSGGVHFGGGGSHWGGGGGGVHVGGSASVHWSTAARPSWQPHRWGVGGHVWVGGGYYYPRPYYYYPTYVPSYYGASYYPVEAGDGGYAGPGGVAVIAPRPALPRLGLGLFAGGVNVNGQPDSSDVGVLGRFRLTPGLLLEGEIGKTSYDVQGVNNLRVDRRMGGSLIYELGAYNRLAPYVLLGMGVQQADVGGSYSTTQDFAEIGAGLRYALSDHFHIAFDVRAGSRSSVANDQVMPVGVARTVTPPTSDSGNSEDYTRARLSAILYF